ncbi:hypothetical protein D3C72_1425940 [compost metagenome]
MIAQPVGHCLDQRGAAAGPGARDRLAHAVPHCDHVVAIDLLAGNAGGNGLLGKRLRGGLLAARHRDCPLVVVDDDDQRRVPRAGHVHAFVEIALGGAAVPDDGHRHAGLPTQLERIGHAGAVAHLGADRHAVAKVMRRRRKAAAALVAAPVQQALGHGDAPHKLRGVVAVGRHQHVVRQHGGGHPDPNGLLPKRGRKGADLPRALHGDGLEIELAGQHHGAIQRQQRGRVAGEGGKVWAGGALGGKVAGEADLEARNSVHVDVPVLEPCQVRGALCGAASCGRCCLRV